MFLSWGPPLDPWSRENVPPQYAEMFRSADLPLRRNYSDKADPYADSWGTPPENYAAMIRQFQKVDYAQTANIDWNLGRLLKLIFYEEAIRDPFFIRWPKRIRGGRCLEALLGTPDIMPTLLGMMGLAAPGSVEGSDLSGPILGRGGRLPEAAYLQGMGRRRPGETGTSGVRCETNGSPTRTTAATAAGCCSTMPPIPTR